MKIKSALLMVVVYSFFWGGFSQAQETISNEKTEQKITTKDYGDWKMRCVTTLPENLDKQCELLYVAQMKEDNISLTILTLSFASDTSNDRKKSNFVLTSVGPMNIYLPEGITYSIDNKYLMKTTFNNCNNAGCWSRQSLSNKVINSIKKGHIGKAKFHMINGQPVTVEFSLNGISTAFDDLSKM